MKKLLSFAVILFIGLAVNFLGNPVARAAPPGDVQLVQCQSVHFAIPDLCVYDYEFAPAQPTVICFYPWVLQSGTQAFILSNSVKPPGDYLYAYQNLQNLNYSWRLCDNPPRNWVFDKPVANKHTLLASSAYNHPRNWLNVSYHSKTVSVKSLSLIPSFELPFT